MRAKTLSSSNFPELLFSFSQNYFSKAQDYRKSSFFSKFPKFKFPFSSKILLAVLGVIVFLAVVILFRTNQNSSAVQQTNNEKPAAPTAKATQQINRVFEFPIRDEEGKEVNKLKFEITTANLQDQILVKGQRATAVKGRTFLILDLKIVNSFDKTIQINTRDYIRLIINGNKNEQIAADIHNDPVEVQAISTKTTRIGFPINESDKNLELLVGEINGKKENIEINFK